jgi:hypothetical protein
MGGVDPALGARRREALLLAGFVIVFVLGVWTVVVTELVPQEPPSGHAAKVAPPTKTTR